MITEVYQVKIPRWVVGVMPRAKKPESFIVADTVPIEVRCYSEGEAPPILRSERGNVYRQIDDRPFGTVAVGGFEKAWENVYDGLDGRIRSEILTVRKGGMDARTRAHRLRGSTSRLFDWETGLKADPLPSPKGEILHEAPPRLREVIDDGRAAQAAAAAFLSGRIAMVGDELLAMTGLPRIRIRKGGSGIDGTTTVDFLAWDDDPDIGEPLEAGDFRLDRNDEAEAFKAAFVEGLPRDAKDAPVQVRGVWSRHQILDRDALSRCYDRVASETVLGLAACAGAAIRAMAYRLAGYPDEDVMRFVEARRAVAERDGDGLASWLEGVERLAGIQPRSVLADGEGMARLHSEIDFAMARIRYRDFVVPRMNLEGGDAEALMAVPRG